MEDQQSALFTLGIDDTAQTHFISIAKWNRFMALVGIIGCSLIVLVLVFGGSFLLTTLTKLGNPTGTPAYTGGVFAGVILFYVLVIGVYLVPCFYMLSFANKMLKAIAGKDQELFNKSLGHLNIYSKYWGILTIIVLSFYLLIIVIALIGLFAAGAMK